MELEVSRKGAARPGFTLIELLVCIAIISILVSLSMAGIARSKESARRAVCQNNLHQIGVAMTCYVDDTGSVPESVGGESTVGVDPTSVGTKTRFRPANYNIETMSRYIPGARITEDPSEFQLSGVWRCPANSKPSMEQLRDEISGSHEVVIPYTFYGRVDLWSNFASRPQDLTANRLLPNRLLATDIFSFSWFSKCWTFNHGPRANWNESPDPSIMFGMNELFGDTRVEWKSARRFKFDRLKTHDPEIGSVASYWGNGGCYY